MGAWAGAVHPSWTAGQALSKLGANPTAASPAATGSTSSSSSSGSSSSSISANDFLTLLVTEMQNQDPTANTDPNEYINQLVQVNSLEQLIDINRNLTTDLGNTGSSSGRTSGSSLAGPGPEVAAEQRNGTIQTAPVAAQANGSTVAAIRQFAHLADAKQAPGNLGVPAASAAAQRVAHALDGRSPARATPGRLNVSQ
jgi:flagellar basal-body rod modification protein FlgD